MRRAARAAVPLRPVATMSSAAPDRSTLVVERHKGTVHRLNPHGELVFNKAGLQTPVDVELARHQLVKKRLTCCLHRRTTRMARW